MKADLVSPNSASGGLRSTTQPNDASLIATTAKSPKENSPGGLFSALPTVPVPNASTNSSATPASASPTTSAQIKSNSVRQEELNPLSAAEASHPPGATTATGKHAADGRALEWSDSWVDNCVQMVQHHKRFVIAIALAYFCGWLSLGAYSIAFISVAVMYVDWRYASVLYQKYSVQQERILHNEKALRKEMMARGSTLPPWVTFEDMERVTWLNRILTGLWPHVGVATCDIIRRSVQPILDANKPAFLKDLRFGTLSLGKIPPLISGMKTHSPKEDQLVIDLDLKYAGDPTITVIARAQAGVSLPVGLTNIQFSAKMRILLFPLVDVFPCFSAVSISFLGKPTLDFDFDAAHLNIMAIPGLSTFLLSFLKETIFAQWIWPKRLPIPILDMTQVQMALVMRNQPKGSLTVKLCQCRNLKNLKRLGTSDPYCTLTLGDKSEKTKVVNNQLNPVYLENFKFDVIDPDTEVLEISVMDASSVAKDACIGRGNIIISGLMPMKEKSMWITIAGDEGEPGRGEVLVQVTWQPLTKEQLSAQVVSSIVEMEKEEKERQRKKKEEEEKVMRQKTRTKSFFASSDAGTTAVAEISPSNINALIDTARQSGILLLRVVRAKDLLNKDAVGKSDPYCKIKVGTQRHLTSVIEDSLDPEWNEEFEFILDDLTPAAADVRISVWDKDQWNDELLGRAVISAADLITYFAHGDSHTEKWLPLKEGGKTYNGQILVALTWKPYTSIHGQEETKEEDDAAGTVGTAGTAGAESKTSASEAQEKKPAARASTFAGHENRDSGASSLETASAMTLPDVPAVLLNPCPTAVSRGVLQVSLVEARDLLNKDTVGKSDPYCKVTINHQKKTTKVIEDNLNPVWNEAFEFNIKDMATSSDLKITVWDKDQIKDEELGYIEFSAKELTSMFAAESAPIEKWIPLLGGGGNNQGKIKIMLAWKPFAESQANAVLAPTASAPEPSIASVAAPQQSNTVEESVTSTVSAPKSPAHSPVSRSLQRASTYTPLAPVTVPPSILSFAPTVMTSAPAPAPAPALAPAPAPAPASQPAAAVEYKEVSSTSSVTNAPPTIAPTVEATAPTAVPSTSNPSSDNINQSSSPAAAVAPVRTTSSVSDLSISDAAAASNTGTGDSTSLPASFVKKGTLMVCAIKARNLPNKDAIGLSDPYCKLKIGEQKHKTRVIENNLNPEWNEQFEFKIEDITSPASLLQVSIWDKDPMTSDLLGVTEVTSNDFVSWFSSHTFSATQWLSLRDEDKKPTNADVLLQFIWQPLAKAGADPTIPGSDSKDNLLSPVPVAPTSAPKVAHTFNTPIRASTSDSHMDLPVFHDSPGDPRSLLDVTRKDSFSSDIGHPIDRLDVNLASLLTNINGKLFVTLQSAERVPGPGGKGTCDPVVQLHVEKQKYKSKVQKNTTAPAWNEKFEFDISDCVHQYLCVHLEADQFLRNTLLGKIHVPVHQILVPHIDEIHQSSSFELTKAWPIEGLPLTLLHLSLRFEKH